MVIFQLLDVPAHFRPSCGLGSGIIKEIHLFGSGYAPVEMIGPDGVLHFIGRQPEPAPEVIRNHRILHSPGRESPFIHGEDYDIPEIYGTCLQRAHNLQPRKGFPAERNRYRTHQSVENGKPCDQFHIQTECIQLSYAGEIMVYVLPVKFIRHRPDYLQDIRKICSRTPSDIGIENGLQHIAAGKHLGSDIYVMLQEHLPPHIGSSLTGSLENERIFQYGHYRNVIEREFPVPKSGFRMQSRHFRHEKCHRTFFQGVAHRDIYGIHSAWNRRQNRQQQGRIRKHHTGRKFGKRIFSQLGEDDGQTFGLPHG